MTVGMVVIVCGSHEGARQRDVSGALDAWHARRPVSVLIHGDCLDPVDHDACVAAATASTVMGMEAEGAFPRGLSVDACARRWAKVQRSLGRGTVVVHDMPPPAWAYCDGPGLRQAREANHHHRMANELKRYRDAGRDVAVLAFPGGSGTADMVKAAKALGLPVWRAANGEWRRDDGG